MDGNIKEKVNSYESILGNLDQKIFDYQKTLNKFPNNDNSKIAKLDTTNDNFKIENKTFFDLISKYQLDNSNLQYENFYLKSQNKFLEEEIKNINQKNDIIKKKLEEFSDKLEKVEQNKEKNLKDLNDKYSNYFNEMKEENDNLLFKQTKKSMETFVKNNKSLFDNFRINLNLKSNNNIYDFKIFENLIYKLIEENKKLNNKIIELNSIIKNNDLNEIKEKIEKKFPSELITSIPTKENTINTEKVNQKPVIPKLNYEQINNNNIIKLKNKKIDNQVLSNIEKNINFNLNKIVNDKNNGTRNLLPKNIISQLSETGDNPLFTLKSKIEMLENILKDANTSPNDNITESVSYYTSKQNRNFNTEY